MEAATVGKGAATEAATRRAGEALRFAPNTLNIFSGLDIGAQLSEISRCGFTDVEILFPYLYPLDMLKGLLETYGLSVSLIDVLPGDVRNLDISAAIDPTRVEEYRKYARLALQTAEVLDVPCINCISGVSAAVPGIERERMLEVYRENLRYTCELFRGTGRRILVEPVSEFQFPGYLVRSLETADSLVRDIGASELSIQFDFFHVQMLHGNLIGNMKRYADRIGYYQIADPPGRHQPGKGEIDFRFVLNELTSLGYRGVIGLEYIPLGPDSGSFDWIDTL